MNNWSSFENDKLIMESWRRHLNEDIEIQRLTEDLDKVLEKLDELFGFGKSREDKWKAIAAGEDEQEPESPPPIPQVNQNQVVYTRQSMRQSMRESYKKLTGGFVAFSGKGYRLGEK